MPSEGGQYGLPPQQLYEAVQQLAAPPSGLQPPRPADPRARPNDPRMHRQQPSAPSLEMPHQQQQEVGWDWIFHISDADIYDISLRSDCSFTGWCEVFGLPSDSPLAEPVLRHRALSSASLFFRLPPPSSFPLL